MPSSTHTNPRRPRKKGRVQVGADADLAIFDPATVLDLSTYTKGDTPSQGIIHVLVDGTFVLRDGELVEDVSPGRAVLGGNLGN